MKQLRSNRLGILCLSFFLCLGVGISIKGMREETKEARAVTTEVIVSKTTNELVTEKGWTVSANNSVGSKFTSFNLDDNITVSFSGSGNTATIWGSKTYDLRVYGTKNKTDGSVTFTGKDDLIIKSITLEFNLEKSPSVSPSITTGTAYEVNANSQTFTLTSDSKNAGQFRITKFTCVYLAETSSDAHYVAITSTDDNIELKEGNTLTMTATCAQEDDVKWSSGDTSVATIDESTGVLTPVGVGTVVITATCSTDSTATATKTITVWKEPDVVSDKKVAEVATLATKEDKTTLYQVTGYISAWVGTSTNGTQYGNYYLKDLDTTANSSLYVYGSSADTTGLTYDYSTTSYTFTNPRDFLSNETTKGIGSTLGYRVTIKGYIRKDNSGNFALTGVITALQDPVTFTVLDIDTKNAKTVYNLLDEFDPTGLVVHACDESLDNIRELTASTDYSWSPTKFETEGTVEVTVTGLGLYAGLTDTFNVTVKNIGFEISPNGDDIDAQMGDDSVQRSVVSLTGFDTSEVAYDWESSATSVATITDNESATATINFVGIGESTISIYVTDGTEELTKTFKVTVIEKQILFTKVTDTSQLIPGKQVMIANSDGTYVMGSQGKNNRAAVDTTKNGDNIVKTDETAVFTLLPAKDNGFAFYDATAEKMLIAGSSSKNYLYTTGDYGNNNSYAKVSVSTSGTTTTTSVVFQGSNTRNTLQYNTSDKLFSCYSNSQAAVSIYIAVEGEPEVMGDTWAKQFIASANCDATGTRTLSTTTWATLTDEFKAQSIPEKMAASYLDVESGTDDFKKAISTYEYCLNKYGYTNFINDRVTTTSSGTNKIMKVQDNMNVISMVIIISCLGVTAIGAHCSLRTEKKTDILTITSI